MLRTDLLECGLDFVLGWYAVVFLIEPPEFGKCRGGNVEGAVGGFPKFFRLLKQLIESGVNHNWLSGSELI